MLGTSPAAIIPGPVRRPGRAEADRHSASMRTALGRRPPPWPTFFRLLALYAVTTSLACVVASHLIWNLTPSTPLGLYWISPGRRLRREDLVAIRVPEAVRALVHARRYLPDDYLIVKPVVALAGDWVCSRDNRLWINQDVFGPIATTDSAGRALPQFSHCGRLQADDAFLASHHPHSFDSRTFGPVDLRQIRGTVTPLWTY